MEFEEAYNLIPGNGWLSKVEAQLMWKYASQIKGVIVEVGSYQGRSACLLANTGNYVICIDPFLKEFSHDNPTTIYENFTFNTIKYDNVKLIKSKIENVSSVFVTQRYGDIKLVYLDGDHTYQGTINQINFAISSKADVILVHDCNDTGGGAAVKRACIEKLGQWKEREERLAVWEM